MILHYDRRLRVALVVSAAIVASTAGIDAQEHVGQVSQAEVEAGFTLYNANCVTCHGANGDSVPGINLRAGQFRRVSSDSDLSGVIQTGVPGTAMPPGRYLTSELGALVAYIRSMHEFEMGYAGRGDAARGRTVFEGRGNCLTCHRVNGKGSRVAPDLSDIGAIRAPDTLERALVDPTASLLPINRPIRAVTRDGEVINGRRLNEDTYTVQLIDSRERLLSLVKADLREYTIGTTSAMPSYKDKLTREELDDVVAYLHGLKGAR